VYGSETAVGIIINGYAIIGMGKLGKWNDDYEKSLNSANQHNIIYKISRLVNE
jgi:hypothetical protein